MTGLTCGHSCGYNQLVGKLESLNWECSLASHGFILRWAGPGFYMVSVLPRVRHPKPQFRRAFHISIGITFANVHPSFKSHRQARTIETGITQVQALPTGGHHSNSLHTSQLNTPRWHDYWGQKRKTEPAICECQTSGSTTINNLLCDFRKTTLCISDLSQVNDTEIMRIRVTYTHTHTHTQVNVYKFLIVK